MESKLNIEELTQLLDLTAADVKANPQLRIGQSLFNNLYSLYPIVAEHIRGMYGLDPFYNDSFITSCLSFITDEDDLPLVKKAYEKFINKLN